MKTIKRFLEEKTNSIEYSFKDDFIQIIINKSEQYDGNV
jgi:hypothetical protein